jgi:PAS domain S-box-containing protein
MLRYTVFPDRAPAVVVVDGDAEALTRCSVELERSGFRVRAAQSLEALAEQLDGQVDAIIAGQPIDVAEVVRIARASRDVPPVVMVRGPMGDAALSEAYEAGADDFVSREASRLELVGRVVGQLRARDHLQRLAHKQRDAQVMLELTRTLASSLDFSEILFTVVRRIAEVVQVDRASIVLVPEVDEPEVGFVAAASDDEGIANLRIELENYPEIREVLRTGEPLTIVDTETHPVLDGVRETIPPGSSGAVTLLPVLWREKAFGVLFLRSSRKAALSAREIEFCRTVTNATSIALRNARVLQSLRDQSQRVNFARFEAERRLRALKRYANLFTSSADGLAAVDADGRMLFANPRAFEIAGVPQDQLHGELLKTLVHADDQSLASEAWRRVRAGDYPRGLDLRMVRPDGVVRTVSCSFSSLVESEGAVLVSFRDVTRDRELASELIETKEFLESLINASVDAIIAADLEGRVLLFNKGAERIYGYTAEEVVGRMRVSALYPEGRAREVMRMLRSPQHGGVGRLESLRYEALDKHGSIIPVNLSVAMIFGADGNPFATVGIFTDLREKLRVEQRLAEAQEKLAISEQQVLIAELAGTAAHELNQPLTSVMGYAQLLQRRLPQEGPERRAIDVIFQESERMAEIVRKIGKITRYETKGYVGSARIFDLDKATREPDEQG